MTFLKSVFFESVLILLRLVIGLDLREKKLPTNRKKKFFLSAYSRLLSLYERVATAVAVK